MIYRVFIFLFFTNHIFADSSHIVQQQNILYVQDLIEKEEKIAKNFEKYILTEFKLPTMEDLRSNNYLGSGFSFNNMMGSDIDFKNIDELQLNYSISKKEFTNKSSEGIDNNLILFYNRDLYRDYTTVFYEIKKENDIEVNNSFVEFTLKSNEAKNIFELLKELKNKNKTMAKNCSNDLKNTYCNNDERTIRYYNDQSNWIEYEKKYFRKGNITLSTESIKDDASLKSEFNKLKIGAYLFIRDRDAKKYIKMQDKDNKLNILKVN